MRKKIQSRRLRADGIEQLKPYLAGAAVILAPFFIQLMMWNGFAQPPRQKVMELKNVEKLFELRTQLQEVTREGRELFKKWGDASFKESNPSDILKLVQDLARLEGVLIKQVRISYENTNKGKKGNPGDVLKVPVTLDVSGNYHKLAQWVSRIENRSELEITNWSLAHEENGDGNMCELHMELNMVTKEI